MSRDKEKQLLGVFLMIQDLVHCPACGAELQKAISFGSCDENLVFCNECGSYIISSQFQEDILQNDRTGDYSKKLKYFLQSHKADKLRPWITMNPRSCPKGYKNYAYFASHFLDR